MASGDGTPRTYEISTETATGAAHGRLLVQEIEDDAGITTALDYINQQDDTLDIYFTSSLSAGEITALDTLVGNHQGTETKQEFQFWEENTAETTTAETWQEKMSRTAAALAGGSFLLSWYCELKVTPTDALNSLAAMRFLVDSNVKGSAQTSAEGWVAFSGWDRYVADEGETPTLSLEIRRDPTVGGDDTIEIRKMKLGFQYVG